MAIRVYNDGKMVKKWECDDFEVLFECGYEVVYVEKDGIRHKAVIVGNFGGNDWNYDVER